MRQPLPAHCRVIIDSCQVYVRILGKVGSLLAMALDMMVTFILANPLYLGDVGAEQEMGDNSFYYQSYH